MTSKIHWMQWHGALGKEEWKVPTCAALTNKVNRKDQGNNTNASEYLDDLEVLDEKMKIVADLIKKSKTTIAYTGAGISRASGIPDYGTKAENSVMNEYKKLQNPVYAQPTYSHHVLANLEKEGLLHYYVQQNHDGLPQKAGFPQEKMNEIHGAWFDPTNPVVQFSGNLRTDLFQQMIEMENYCDLCLCLGTSLSGMNADRCVWTPCKKFNKGVKGCLGSVIVNLQFTPVDKKIGYCPIRIWAKIDDAMKLLVKHLDLEMKSVKHEKIKTDRIICKYNKDGRFDESKRMIFDLSFGKKIKVVAAGAVNEGKIGTCVGKDKEGNFFIKFEDRTRRLGYWWLNTIQKGEMFQIPIVNAKCLFKKTKK